LLLLLITLLTLGIGYAGCATKKHSTVIEIRYLVVVDPALPFVEDYQINNWLEKVEEIFKEADDISIHFVPAGKVHLETFLRGEQWGQRDWFQSQKFNAQIDSLIESRLRQYDLNYIKDYFEDIKRKGRLSQSFFLKDVQNAQKLDIDFFIMEIKKYLTANIEAFREKVRIHEDQSSDHIKFSLMAGWQNALRDLKGADMILTNEIGADIYTLGDVFNENSFRVSFTPGLADFETSRILVSAFPWLYARPQDSVKDYTPAKDYFTSAVISHEIAHAIFHLQHDFTRGDFIMSASENTQSNWFNRKPRFSEESKNELHAWVLVKEARQLEHERRHQEAITRLQGAIQVKKDYLPAYQMLAGIYDQDGQKESAARIRQASKEIDDRAHWLENYSRVAFASYAKGKELELLGRSDEAIEEYKKVVYGENTNNALNYDLLNDLIIEAYRNMGILYTNEMKHDEGIKVLNKLLQIQPKDPKALYLLGRNYYFKNDKPNAVWALKSFLALEQEGLDAESARSLLNELSQDNDVK